MNLSPVAVAVPEPEPEPKPKTEPVDGPLFYCRLYNNFRWQNSRITRRISVISATWEHTGWEKVAKKIQKVGKQPQRQRHVAKFNDNRATTSAYRP